MMELFHFYNSLVIWPLELKNNFDFKLKCDFQFNKISQRCDKIICKWVALIDSIHLVPQILVQQEPFFKCNIFSRRYTLNDCLD